MPHKLNIVQRVGDIKGVQQTSYMTLADFNGIADPLANNTDASNKAATSIPSMFARILFFRTAFESCSVNPTLTNSVYAKYVSDCLDLLEDLFNHNTGLSFVRWNKVGQIGTLATNPVLQDALNTQMDRFLHGVSDIYLIIQNGQVIGGTSPFSIVYTSPNWNNTRAITMLVNRTPKFRDFMYKFADAYAMEPSLREFINYINSSQSQDILYRGTNYGGLWPIANLQVNYPPLQYNGGNIIVKNDPNVPLYLFGNNQNAFESDLFIDSTLQPFNAATTPLLLVSGTQPLSYYDGVAYSGWGHGYTEVWNPNNDTDIRNLPEGNGLQHCYITPIDLLEESLIKVPYKIDEACWDSVINIDENTGCMLPLKPLLFKYFSVQEVKNMLKVTIDTQENNKVIVSLDIPVRNSNGGRRNIVSVVKEYPFSGGIQKLSTLGEGFTLGVSPFYKDASKYHIIQGEKCDVNNNVIEFYGIGDKEPLNIVPTEIMNDGAVILKLYTTSQTFDYLRVVWDGIGHGVLLPNFKCPTANGTVNYIYGVDFGTTNTHVAFTKQGSGIATSFTNEDYKWHIKYLSDKGKTGDDSIKTALARTFYPDYSENDYEFPIRTVVSTRGVLGVNSNVFENISIGLRYSKEYAPINIYETGLKWKFDNNPANAIINAEVRCFCEEILMMIRNHWMLHDDAIHNASPKIAITYPAAMLNLANVQQVWNNAYVNIFGEPARFDWVTESLAPCRTAIALGTGVANGILNIDIGGGTTDFQYYRQFGADIVSLYNSIKFAGDDLWGKGYENVAIGGIGAAITNNNFTLFAQKKLQDAQIKIGTEIKNIQQITIQEPKEFVGLLLKDSEHNFANALRQSENNVCRQIMYLHYAAIIRYAVKWLQNNGVREIPYNITFTGMGSKYLEMLFGRPNLFQIYSKRLIMAFSGNNVENTTIALPANNPKNITAEGACLYSADGASPVCVKKSYLGCDVPNGVTYANVATLKETVIASLGEFLDVFNSIGDCDGALCPQEVICISDNTKTQILRDAENSFANMETSLPATLNRNLPIQDAIFFWALKDSLWRIS